MHRASFLSLCALVSLSMFGTVAHAQVTETYVFRDSLDPNEGAGNTLEPTYNGTGTILTSGAGFIGGSYVTETISASACPSPPTVRAWSFPVSGGLRHANAAPVVVTGSYSISMLMRYSPMDAGYARLVDFSNSMSDTGIYKLGAGVSFYPVGTFAPGSFVTDQDVFVTITRDAATQLVSLYINGVASGTYVDTGNLYAPAASVMYFLMDNTTGSAAISETDAGVIAYLQVRDTPMTPAEVAASLAGICETVACGDGTVNTGEECDDGNVLDGDGCSFKCLAEAGFVCTGTPSVCTRLCGNGTLDGTEECDDGAALDGDGCSSACLVESGYLCSGAPSVCMAVADGGVADAGIGDAGGDGDASVADGGPPDMGMADAGSVDAGLRDAGGPGDASAGMDASTVPPTDSGGCGCLIAGSAARSSGAWLASMALLALFAARRARRRSLG